MTFKKIQQLIDLKSFTNYFYLIFKVYYDYHLKKIQYQNIFS